MDIRLERSVSTSSGAPTVGKVASSVLVNEAMAVCRRSKLYKLNVEIEGFDIVDCFGEHEPQIVYLRALASVRFVRSFGTV